MNTDTSRIRKALPEDEPSVLALVERLVAFGPPPWRDPQQMVRIDRQKIARALRSPGDDPLVLVAAVEDTIAGFVHLHSLTDHYNEGAHGHVSDIVVASEYEGMGIGRQFLDAARSWAIAKGFGWLTISVFEENDRAVALYEKAGFMRDILRLSGRSHAADCARRKADLLDMVVERGGSSSESKFP